MIHFKKTKIKTNTSFITESLERQIERMMANKEPIRMVSPLMLENGDNVNPHTNIRTDTQELACETLGRANKEYVMKRGEMIQRKLNSQTQQTKQTND